MKSVDGCGLMHQHFRDVKISELACLLKYITVAHGELVRGVHIKLIAEFVYLSGNSGSQRLLHFNGRKKDA